MKKWDRLVCVLASFVPALFVWLAWQRQARFLEFMSQYLGSRRYQWATPISALVFDTIRFWPWVVVLGWVLLVPAMFGKAWCRRLRVTLTCAFCVLGPVLYGLCLEGLNHSQMNVLQVWDRSNQQLQERREAARKQTSAGDSTNRTNVGPGTPEK